MTLKRPVIRSTSTHGARPKPKTRPNHPALQPVQRKPQPKPSPPLKAKPRPKPVADALGAAVSRSDWSRAEYALGTGTYLEAGDDLAGLPALMEEQLALKARLHEAEAWAEREKAVRQEIEALLIMAGRDDDGVTIGRWGVSRVVVNGRSTLSPTKLAELGVSADIIAQAKVPGQAYSFVKIVDLEKEAREQTVQG